MIRRWLITAASVSAMFAGSKAASREVWSASTRASQVQLRCERETRDELKSVARRANLTKEERRLLALKIQLWRVEFDRAEQLREKVNEYLGVVVGTQ